MLNDYNAIWDKLPIGIAVMDSLGKIQASNKAFRKLLGYEIISTSINHWEITPQRWHDLERRILSEQALVHGQSEEYEKEYLSRDGRVIPVQVRMFSMMNGETNPGGFCVLVRNSSDRNVAAAEWKSRKLNVTELIDYSPEAIVILDSEDVIVKTNREWTRLFGYTAEEAVGRKVSRLIVPTKLKSEGLDLNWRAVSGERIAVETVRQKKDGSLVDVTVLGTPILLEGNQVGVYGIYHDISRLKKSERALRASEDKHRRVLEAAPDPVVVHDRDGNVTYLNPAFTRVFGWTFGELRGRKLYFVPEEKRAESERIIARIERGEVFSGIETTRLTRDNRRVEVSISGTAFTDSENRKQGYVITYQDISQRKRNEEEIQYIAYHDLLTGLPNRRAFYQRLEDELNQSGRRSSRQTWALLFMDLDRFKFINDTLGHDTGDELLKQTAERIRHCIRKSDHVFRLGGDEFTVILRNLNNDIDVAKVARKIRKEVAKPCFVNGEVLYVTTSIGISVYPHDGREVEVLVKNADIAMFAAKEEGRGYRFFTEEMNHKALDRLKLESGLKSALGLRQFLIHYQPIMAAPDKVIGLEALLRWQHPEMGLIAPNRFISLAEETGAIIPIGEWVIINACRQARKLHDLGFNDLFMAVNLSPRQFMDGELVEKVLDALSNAGLPPHYLKLEVTESCVMDDPEGAIVKMEQLRSMGIRISVDDFGTGYSSLSYLKRFPIDTLKIDRSFVSEAIFNRDDREIIRTIIAMARNLKIETVAEGVETSGQKELLIQEGCHVMQGFLFGRPMPFEQVVKWMK